MVSLAIMFGISTHSRLSKRCLTYAKREKKRMMPLSCTSAENTRLNGHPIKQENNMPRLSYNAILNQLRQCQIENGDLATDEEWNVVTRKAFPYRMRREAESARWVVTVLIHSSDNGSIRRALNVRAPQVLIRCRWSKNEAILILSADPVAVCSRLSSALKNEGVTASKAYVPYSGNVNFDYNHTIIYLTGVPYEHR